MLHCGLLPLHLHLQKLLHQLALFSNLISSSLTSPSPIFLLGEAGGRGELGQKAGIELLKVLDGYLVVVELCE